MPEMVQGDPNGVPRPVDPERIDRARANSGIIVGEQAVPVKTTAGTEQDNYRTAFVKVYQDAGVIGVAMLTLLALCVLMAIFCNRVLRMYSAAVSEHNKLLISTAQATEKLANSYLLLNANVTALSTTVNNAVAEIRREHDEEGDRTRDLIARMDRMEERSKVPLDLLSRALAEGRVVVGRERGIRTISNEGERS